MLTLVWFIAGLALLVAGAELLVKGASRIAVRAGISPLVVGLTVVALGTSTPELAVSIDSARSGFADVTIGNVVGSNIANILLVLGICALIRPISVAQQIVRFDVPILIGASLLVLLFGWSGDIGFIEGSIFLAGFLGYTIFAVVQSRKETSAVRAEYEAEYGEAAESRAAGVWWHDVVFVVVGLTMLVFGADWLVDSAVKFARVLGVSDLTIALTVVAVGTSLPEVATSVMAAIRNEQDIAVGNAVGSNIANIFLVLGATTFFAPGGGVAVSQAALSFDIPVMIAVAVASLPIFFSNFSLLRWEGGLFLAYYAAYIVYLVLLAVESPMLPVIDDVMLLFVIPLTVITIAVVAVRAHRRRARA